jgi:hypothetical protein
MVKYQMLLKPLQGGVDGNLYFPVLSINRLSQLESRKTESLKKAQTGKIKNVADSVWLSLFMDGTEECKK